MPYSLIVLYTFSTWLKRQKTDFAVCLHKEAFRAWRRQKNSYANTGEAEWNTGSRNTAAETLKAVTSCLHRQSNQRSIWLKQWVTAWGYSQDLFHGPLLTEAFQIDFAKTLWLLTSQPDNNTLQWYLATLTVWSDLVLWYLFRQYMNIYNGILRFKSFGSVRLFLYLSTFFFTKFLGSTIYLIKNIIKL